MFYQLLKRVLLLLLICTTNILFAQQDSIIKKTAGDSAVQSIDTSGKNISRPAVAKFDSALYKSILLSRQILQKHPYFNFHTKASPPAYTKKGKTNGKEIYFCALAVILLIFAISKTVFEKYFNDLISLFFRRTLKQRQLQQQLLQEPLPSLIFNMIFVIVAGIYIALLFQDLGRNLEYSFWKLAIYSVLAIAIIYLIKYILLQLSGWLFNLKKLTDAYIFLIFLVNKIIALFLLPVIVMIALGSIELKAAIWTLSWVVLAGLYIYRFIVALRLARKEAIASIFHFSLYIIAFEILPVLVIYKAISFF